MSTKLLIIISILITGSTLINTCGPDITIRDRRTDTDLDSSSNEVQAIQKQIAYLAEVVSSFSSSSDFSTCNEVNLSALELHMCQIAQSATAEQQVLLAARLAELARVLQKSLYGDDCIPDSMGVLSGGCPLPGSIVYRLGSVDADLVMLHAQVTSLISEIAALNLRLDSVESVITVINSTLASLDTRLDSVEATVSASDMLSIIEICDNITPTTGPVFEAFLISGDRAKLMAFVQTSGSKRGLSVLLSETDASLYTTTTLNTQACKFKVYTYGLHLGLKVCWHKTNRSATEAQINTACTPTIGSNCTCK